MIQTSELSKEYEKAQALLAAGEIQQAKNICQFLLSTAPEYAYGHYLMAALFLQTGDLDRALFFNEMAIGRAPENVDFHIGAAEIHRQRDDWNAMAAAAQKAKALAPATPEIGEYEGLLLMAQGDRKEAEKCFDRLIGRLPDSYKGYAYKGELLEHKGQDDKAEQYFVKALALSPRNAKLSHKLALLYRRTKQLHKALEFAVRATQLDPKNRQAYQLAGAVMVELNMPDAAEQVFRNLFMSAPDDLNAAYSLIQILMKQAKKDEALPVAEHALQAHPDNIALQHYRAILRGENVERAPDEYLAMVFDDYAHRFDQHLQQVLLYKTPTVLADLLCQCPQLAGKSSLELLDLGCGTGLAAEALKNVTALRVGIDLSQKMLDKAKRKNLYAELHRQDIVTFMQSCARRFNLVVATDVLIYMGNLAPFFTAARNILAPDGLLAFSIENEEGALPFRLNGTGRYSHRADYILSLAQKEGYERVAQETSVLRFQENKPVHGMLFIFTKA